MPTYEYQCNACGHEFELFQQMTEPVKKKCPECGKLKLQRLIGTGAGVLFKGSGFYETDYRSDSYKKAAEAETKSSESSSSGEGASKDAKPQAKDGAASSNGKAAKKPSTKAKKSGK